MHKYPNKHLKVLIVEDVEEEFEENKIMAVEVCDKDGDSDGEIIIMCLNNLIPATKEKFQTIRFQGKIQGVPVVILVDSGATHNFIDQKLVRRMGWKVEETPNMTIRLGDGFQTSTRGRCVELEVELNEFKIKCSPHLFELGGPDLVLGVEWLKTLGDTIVNWNKHTMSF